MDILAPLYIFILAAFVGYNVIHKVPPLLHTPLMSATNAISAISVVGAIIVAGMEHNDDSTRTFAVIMAVTAVAAAMTNVVGGFLITDRMLKMFKKEKPTAATPATEVKK
ncbi:MAG: NAD(P) transhydrogenase subunit alpha [Spirochaetes bacterium]|nr:NAD(P) transhydrogenase subunit alpha [Spirochaetota bacterium]